MSRTWLVLLVLGCSSGGAELRVDLITNYAPGTEFDGVRVEVERDGVSLATREVVVELGDDYLSGARVADVDGLRAGPHRVYVTLFLDGVARIRHLVVVDHPGGALAITALVTRNCEGVSCPGDGDPMLSQCLDGRCVDATCSPTTPELCPPADCSSDSECSPTLECARSACLEGVCGDVLDDGLCSDGDVCRRALGCVAPDGGNCGTNLSCELFDPSCLSTLARRCVLFGIDDSTPRMLMRLIIFDPDTGASCVESSADSSPGFFSGAPQLFQGSILLTSRDDTGACAVWSFSLDTAVVTVTPSPCGLVAPLDEELVWFDSGGMGDVIHKPGSADVPFSVAETWGSLWSIGRGEVALPQSDGQWVRLDVSSATVVGMLQEPETTSGIWRDATGTTLWITGSDTDRDVVHLDAEGTEIARVPIADLPPLAGFANYVGVGCAF